METSYLSSQELQQIGFASLGASVQISRFARFYGAENLSIGDFVRIDDFVVISTLQKSSIGKYVHIAPAVVISSPLSLQIGDYSTISSRCSVYGQSDDFSGDYLTNPTLPKELRNLKQSEIRIGEHVIIGTGSTLLPGANLGNGVALGAMSLLKDSADEWCIYAGIPASRLKTRSKSCLDLI